MKSSKYFNFLELIALFKLLLRDIYSTLIFYLAILREKSLREDKTCFFSLYNLDDFEVV